MRTEKCNKVESASVTIAELIYCTYFAIMLFAKGIGLYEGQTAYTVCLLISAFLLIFKLMITKHSVFEYIIIGILGSLGCVVFFNISDKSALIYIMMIIGMKGVSLKKVFKVGTFVWGITFFSQIILSVLEMKPDLFFIHKKLGLGHLIRWSLGYPHPNVLHISYFILLAFILYFLRAESPKLEKLMALMFLGNMYIFTYSLSYTGFALTTVFLIIYYYMQKRKKLSKVESILVQCVFPVCVIFSIFGPLIIKGKLFDIINKILNSRFYLSQYFLTTQEIKLFGTTFHDLPDTSYNLDCSYVNVLFCYGIILSLCIFIGYIILIWKLYKHNRRKELAITLSIIIAGMSEPFLVNTSYKNLTFLFMGEMLFQMTERYVVSCRNIFIKKEFAILPIGKKEFKISRDVSGEALEQIKYVFRCYKKWILIVSLLTFLGISVGYSVITRIPDQIYALLWSCDRKDDAGQASDAHYVYLDLEQLPEDFNGRILNYKDKETPLYSLDGITVYFEYARKAISYGLIGAMFFSIIIVGSMCVVMKFKHLEKS